MVLGAVIASGCAGPIAWKLGRKTSLWIACFLLSIGNILMMVCVYILSTLRSCADISTGYYKHWSSLRRTFHPWSWKWNVDDFLPTIHSRSHTSQVQRPGSCSFPILDQHRNSKCKFFAEYQLIDWLALSWLVPSLTTLLPRSMVEAHISSLLDWSTSFLPSLSLASCSSRKFHQNMEYQFTDQAIANHLVGYSNMKNQRKHARPLHGSDQTRIVLTKKCPPSKQALTKKKHWSLMSAGWTCLETLSTDDEPFFL